MLRFSRREFLGATAAAAVLRGDPWAQVPAILARIQPPKFPDREFDVTRYGARPDGKTDATEAFRKAIAACSQAGGGRVVARGGEFLTGAIHLQSHVNLHVAAGATLRFSTDPRQYLPVVFTRWEGTECVNYSALIYAYGQQNVAVTGEGTLDGQAADANWWAWKGRRGSGEGDPNQTAARDRLVKMADQGVAPEKRVFGAGGYLRPNFIQTYKCQNVLIDGITIRNSPMWEIHPALSRNVTVRGVKISSHGPNNDGCDPESCSDVLIKDCIFDTGDDCIAIKSGRNNDGRRVNVPVENVIVQGCTMKDGHGGVTIGSEISGSARHIFAEDCRMDSPNLDRALRLKTNSYRGGVIEDVHMRNVAIGQVARAIVDIDFFYEEGDGGPFPPTVRNIGVQNVTCKKSRQALYLRGFKTAPIRDVYIQDCTFDGAAEPSRLENVEGLRMVNVRINGQLQK
jgi:polygalacturonase